MTLMVDLELIVDVLEDDPNYGKISAALIDEYRHYGELYISPIAYIQLGPLFGGMKELQDRFLDSMGIALAQKQAKDTSAVVLSAWCKYVKKTGANACEMPFTKLLIGASALNHDSFLTRRAADFHQFFPKLKCITPPPPPRCQERAAKGGAV